MSALFDVDFRDFDARHLSNSVLFFYLSLVTHTALFSNRLGEWL